MPLSSHAVIFGGSFDPPHVGHQAICLWLLEALNADRVLVVPTYKHCFGKALTDFDHRINMCKDMVRHIKFAQVECVEKDLPQPNYTINLVKHFKKQYHNVAVVVGGDNLSQLDKWEKWDEIPQLAKIIAVGRPGYNGETTLKNVQLYPVGISTVSSTEIRERILSKLPLIGFVPREVEYYINENNLYT